MVQLFYEADGRVVRKVRDDIAAQPTGDEVGVVVRDRTSLPDPAPPEPAEKHTATLYYDEQTDSFSYTYTRNRAEFARELDPTIKDDIKQYREFVNQDPDAPVTRRQLWNVLKTFYKLLTDGEDL